MDMFNPWNGTNQLDVQWMDVVDLDGRGALDIGCHR